MGNLDMMFINQSDGMNHLSLPHSAYKDTFNIFVNIFPCKLGNKFSILSALFISVGALAG